MFMHSQDSNFNVCSYGQQILQTGVYLSDSNVAGWKERSLAMYPGIGNNLIQTLTNTETLCICLLQTKCLSDHQTVSETPSHPGILTTEFFSHVFESNHHVHLNNCPGVQRWKHGQELNFSLKLFYHSAHNNFCLCLNGCNTANAFKERLSKSACCYPICT